MNSREVNNPKRILSESVLDFGAKKSRLQDLDAINILEVEDSKWPEIVSAYVPSAVICA